MVIPPIFLILPEVFYSYPDLFPSTQIHLQEDIMIRFILLVGIISVVVAYPITILLAFVFLVGYHCCCQKGMAALLCLLDSNYPSRENTERRKQQVDDEWEEWSAKTSAAEDLDKKLDHETMKTEEFKAEGRRMAAIIAEKQRKADLELEEERDKTIVRKTTPKKPPIVKEPVKQNLSDEEIYAAMDELNNGTASVSDDFAN